MTQIISSFRLDKFILVSKDFLKEILFKLDFLISDKKISQSSSISEDWLDERETQKLIGKKGTSLWKLRKNKSIRSSKKPFFYIIHIVLSK